MAGFGCTLGFKIKNLISRFSDMVDYIVTNVHTVLSTLFCTVLKIKRTAMMMFATEVQENEKPHVVLDMEVFQPEQFNKPPFRRRQSQHDRRHEFFGIRLQSYTDAVFAIVGTILIAYLNQVVVPRLVDGSNSLQHQGFANTRFFTIYHFTFLHISIIWLNHSRVFTVIERVNDVVIWLNMVFLYVVSFVPLNFGILGEFNNHYEGIVIPSITLILINIAMAAIIWYAFRRKRFLLSPDMSDTHAKYFERTMYFKLSITPVFVGLASVFGKFSLLAGQIFFYSSVFVVVIPKVIAYCIRRRYKTEMTRQIVKALSATPSKDRIEFFADGVYSIVATLVILDVTTVGIPSLDVVNERYDGSLIKALRDKQTEYLSYLSTFVVISLMWFVHHSLFNFIKDLNPLMFTAHQCSLSIVGVVPGSIDVLTHTGVSGADGATAMQVASSAVASVSLFQFLLFALMAFASDKCVDQSLFHSSKSSLYLLGKVVILPITSVISYWCSFGSEGVRRSSLYIVHITTLLSFVLINIVIRSKKLHSFCLFCWKKFKSQCFMCALLLCNFSWVHYLKNFVI